MTFIRWRPRTSRARHGGAKPPDELQTVTTGRGSADLESV